jgi:hypothetical protein
MSFPELLSLLAFTTPFGCCAIEGWNAGRSFGLFIGLIVGLVLSMGSFLGTKMLFKQIAQHPDLILLQAGLVLWILGFIWGGMWLTTFVIHHVAV